MDKCGLIDQPRLTENDLQISPGKKIRPTRHWSRITFCPLSAFSFSAFQLSRRVVVPQPRDEGGSTPQRLNFSFQLSCRAVVLARRRISLSAFQLFGPMVHEEFGLRQALGRHVTASSQLACPACHLSLTLFQHFSFHRTSSTARSFNASIPQHLNCRFLFSLGYKNGRRRRLTLASGMQP